MNTLQDLRATLDQHASGVHDDPTTARVAAVRGRARRARQQRSAAVVGGAVVAVVATATVALIPGDRSPQPTDRTVLGQEAPAELSSLGWSYEFAEAFEGEDGRGVRLRLPRQVGPRLVTWTTASEGQDVAYRLQGYEDGVSGAPDFEDFVWVPPGYGGRLDLDGPGEVAAVVYELTDETPAGMSEDGVLFREEVGSETLVDAAFGQVGVPQVLLETVLPEGDLRVAEFCADVPEDVWVNVSINGEGAVASSGCGGDTFDPAIGTASYLDAGTVGEPGETVEIRMWLSREFRGEPVTRVPGARLALGLYALGEPAAVMFGSHTPDLVEHEGHRWGFVEAVTSTAPGDLLRFQNEGTRPLLLVGSYSRIGRSTLGFRVGDGGMDRTSGGLGGGDIRGMLLPGEAAAMRVGTRGGIPDSAEFGFAVYERVD